MEGLNVEDWVAHEPSNEWETMMKKVAKFHHKHDFAGKNGHDMGYRIALTVEELGELSAAITKGKPLEECAEEIDLKSAFEKKYARIMQRKALTGRLGVRVTEYKNE